jgi:hypothetical protein
MDSYIFLLAPFYYYLSKGTCRLLFGITYHIPPGGAPGGGFAVLFACLIVFFSYFRVLQGRGDVFCA